MEPLVLQWSQLPLENLLSDGLKMIEYMGINFISLNGNLIEIFKHCSLEDRLNHLPSSIHAELAPMIEKYYKNRTELLSKSNAMMCVVKRAYDCSKEYDQRELMLMWKPYLSAILPNLFICIRLRFCSLIILRAIHSLWDQNIWVKFKSEISSVLEMSHGEKSSALG